MVDRWLASDANMSCVDRILGPAVAVDAVVGHWPDGETEGPPSVARKQTAGGPMRTISSLLHGLVRFVVAWWRTIREQVGLYR